MHKEATNHLTSVNYQLTKISDSLSGSSETKYEAFAMLHQIASSVKYHVSQVLIFIFSSFNIPENQNYLNYQQQQQQHQQQQQPQGRFLSSFQQNSRNGFFPIQRQPQSNQGASYQQQDLFDGPSSPSSFFPFQSFAVSQPKCDALESKSARLIFSDMKTSVTSAPRVKRLKPNTLITIRRCTQKEN